jgi:hypothetical protein
MKHGAITTRSPKLPAEGEPAAKRAVLIRPASTHVGAHQSEEPQLHGAHLDTREAGRFHIAADRVDAAADAV